MCINGVKELSLANKMYFDDNQAWVGPLSLDPTLSQGDWMGAMLSYYGKATNILSVPLRLTKGNPNNLVNPPGKADSAWHWTLSNPTYASSYAINKWLGSMSNSLANGQANPQYIYVKESLVLYPSTTPSFMDSAWLNLDPLETDTPARNLYDPLSGSSSENAPGMRGGMAAGHLRQPREMSRRVPCCLVRLTWGLLTDMLNRRSCRICGLIIGIVRVRVYRRRYVRHDNT